MVAALFVRKRNHYAALGVDCYDFDRDALTWQGGCPGIFHPPCRSWSQLSHMAKPRPGEKELAIWAMQKVREFGGVVEHPYNSRLWAHSGCLGFGLRDQYGGVLVPVMQSWFGHRAPKRTSLYIVGPVPEIPYVADAPTVTTVERMGRAERERTPEQFASWLVELAERCR
ncbi:hypothetical protein PMI14_02388 [Acidovorax sp. CF316]|uniref:hypothetical protein n=1 Tax=Acidovorax sp. CF316 TaxID=1144317 RepID=UPI00026BDB09|nr:hypothetical protein [Acidovorax sp. CF316]EJE52909.1 hypothetical protein PMI14_02388 [Acidovorax sp. CF316]